MKRMIFAVLGTLMVSACGSSGGSSASCDSITGGNSTVTSSCTGCSINNPQAAADGSLSSFARATVSLGGGNATATIRASAQEGIVFPSGSNAGVFYTPGGSVCNNCAITINTYLDGSPQESRSGVTNDTGSGSPATFYTGVSTTLPFDAVEIVDSGTLLPTDTGTLLDVYEICSDGSY